MPFIKKIVEIIDENVKTSDAASIGKLQVQKFHGLAKLGYETMDKGVLKQYPIGMFNAESIQPDDRYNLITYHRVIGSKQYTNVGGYGSDSNYITETVPMMLVVMGYFNKLNITDEQLEQIFLPHLAYNLVTDAASIGIRRGAITPVSTNFDSMALFNQEYKNVQPFLKTNLMYFQIRYQIESTYDKNCFNNTTCG